MKSAAAVATGGADDCGSPPPGRRAGWAALALTAGAALAGCAAPNATAPGSPGHHVQPIAQQLARERELRAHWRERPYAELVAAIGAPKRKLTIPGRDPALTWAAYYGVRDSGAGCFDAFTIVVGGGEERVVDYFCR